MARNYQTGIIPLFIMIVDISGYTNFIRLHKASLLHAERIIGELMESILNKVKAPVVAHEILGDAISLYAIDDGSPNLADNIYQQIEIYFQAFREKEAVLISKCGICPCDACKKVGKLKLKAILHAGKAAFTRILNRQKIAGEDIIAVHRLLKNTISSDEYIFVTDSYIERCQSFDHEGFRRHIEACSDLMSIPGMVKKFGFAKVVEKKVAIWKKLKFLMKLDGYLISRIFSKAKLKFRNLPMPDSQTSCR